jgi:hypothetical protein
MTAPARSAHRLLGFGLAAVLACAGAAGCATAAPYNPSGLPAAELGQVREICRTTLGIPAGFGLSASCVEGLSRSAASLDQSRSLATARGRCLDQGLRPGEAGLGECELTSAASYAPPSSAATGQARDSAATPHSAAGSYFNASSGEIRRREQLACARLGLDPIYPSFATCVVRLDSALSDAERAAH